MSEPAALEQIAAMIPGIAACCGAAAATSTEGAPPEGTEGAADGSVAGGMEPLEASAEWGVDNADTDGGEAIMPTGFGPPMGVNCEVLGSGPAEDVSPATTTVAGAGSDTEAEVRSRLAGLDDFRVAPTCDG